MALLQMAAVAPGREALVVLVVLVVAVVMEMLAQ
jgi:hypothetical protein